MTDSNTSPVSTKTNVVHFAAKCTTTFPKETVVVALSPPSPQRPVYY